MPERVLSEFYAQTWRDGRRQLRKLGAWPALSLADARERFKIEAAPLIAERRPLARAAGPRLGTLRELLASYVAHLEGEGRRSAYQYRRLLLDASESAAAFLGGDRLARDVSAEDCRRWLAHLAARSDTGRAEHPRQALRAAFAHTCAPSAVTPPAPMASPSTSGAIPLPTFRPPRDRAELVNAC